jgi:hypothetical protein
MEGRRNSRWMACFAMTIRDNIKEFPERTPFVPFRLVLGSGSTYDVRDPHSAALLKADVFVVFPDGERWAHVPLLHIALIETVANGRSRRTRK